MIRIAALGIGFLLFVAPLWFLSSAMIPVPEYRTGTWADVKPLLTAIITLYGGVAAGIFARSRMEPNLRSGMTGRAILVAGIAGAIAAIFVALVGWAVIRWLTTGRVLKPGQTLALMPMFPILGGLLSAFIAGGSALVATGLRRSKS